MGLSSLLMMLILIAFKTIICKYAPSITGQTHHIFTNIRDKKGWLHIAAQLIAPLPALFEQVNSWHLAIECSVGNPYAGSCQSQA